MMKQTFPCQLKSLTALRQMIQEFCRAEGLNEIVCGELELAANEACTNIINHGGLKDGGHYTVEMERRDSVIIRITDHGKKYDFQAIKVIRNRDDIKRMRPTSGMGVYIIRKLADGVIYNYMDDQKVNELTLIKNC